MERSDPENSKTEKSTTSSDTVPKNPTNLSQSASNDLLSEENRLNITHTSENNIKDIKNSSNIALQQLQPTGDSSEPSSQNFSTNLVPNSLEELTSVASNVNTVTILNSNPFGMSRSSIDINSQQPVHLPFNHTTDQSSLEETESELFKLRQENSQLRNLILSNEKSAKLHQTSIPSLNNNESSPELDISEQVSQLLEEKRNISDELIESRRIQELLYTQIIELNESLTKEKKECQNLDRAVFNAIAEKTKVEGELIISRQRFESVNSSLKISEQQLEASRSNHKTAIEELSQLKFQKYSQELELDNLKKANEANIQRLRDQVQQLEDKISEQNQELLTIRTDTEQTKQFLKRKLDNSNEIIDVKEAIIKKLEGQNISQSTVIKELQSEISDNTDHISLLKKDIESLNEQLQSLREEKENLKTVYGSEQARIMQNLSMQQVRDLIERKFKDKHDWSTDDKVIQLIIELESKSAECLEYRGNYLQCKSELESLKHSHGMLNRDLTELESKLATAYQESDLLNNALKNTWKDNTTHNSINSDLKQRLRASEGRVTQLENHCRQLVSKVSLLMYEKENENAEKSSLSSPAFESFSELVEQNNQMKLNIQRLMDSKNSHNDTLVNQLEMDVNEYRQQLDIMRTERDSFSDEVMKTINDLKSQRDHLESKLHKQTQAAQVIIPQNNESAFSSTTEESNSFQEMQVIVSQLKIALEDLQKARREQHESIEKSMKLEQLLEVAKSTSEFYKSQLEQMSIRRESLYTDLQDKSSSFSQLEVQNNRLKVEKEEMNDKLNSLTLQIQDLTRQINDLHGKLKLEKNLLLELQRKYEDSIQFNDNRFQLIQDSLSDSRAAIKMYQRQYEQLLEKSEQDLKLFQKQTLISTEAIKSESHKKRKLEEVINEKTVEIQQIKSTQDNYFLELSIVKSQLEERTKQIEYLKGKRAFLDDDPINYSDNVNKSSSGPLNSRTIPNTSSSTSTPTTEFDLIDLSVLNQKLNDSQRDCDQLKQQLEEATSIQHHWKLYATKTREEVDYHKNIAQQKESIIDTKQAEITVLEYKVKEIEGLMESKEGEINEKVNKINALTLQLESQSTNVIQQKLNAANDIIQALEREKNLLMNDKDQLQLEIHQQVQYRSKDIDQMQTLKSQNELLKESNSTLTAERNKLSIDYKNMELEKNLEIQLLQKQILNSQVQLDRHQEDLHALEKALHSKLQESSDELVTLRMEELLYRKADLESELKAAHILIAKGEAIQTRLKNELEEERERFKIQQENLLNMKADIDLHQSLVQQVAEDASLRSSLKQIKLEKEALQKSRNDLKERLEHEIQLLEPLKLKEVQMSSQISNLEKQKKQLEEQSKTWETSYNSIVTLYKGVDREEFVHQKEKIRLLEEQTSNFTIEKQKVVEHNNELNRKYEKNLQSISELSGKLEIETTKLSSLENEKSTIKKRLEETLEQLQKSRNEAQSLRAANAAVNKLRTDLIQEQDKTKNLQEQVNRLSKASVSLPTKQSSTNRTLNINFCNSISRLAKLVAVSYHISRVSVNSVITYSERYSEQLQKEELANAAAALSQQQIDLLKSQGEAERAEISRLQESYDTLQETLRLDQSEYMRLKTDYDSLLYFIENSENQPKIGIDYPEDDEQVLDDHMADSSTSYLPQCENTNSSHRLIDADSEVLSPPDTLEDTSSLEHPNNENTDQDEQRLNSGSLNSQESPNSLNSDFLKSDINSQQNFEHSTEYQSHDNTSEHSNTHKIIQKDELSDINLTPSNSQIAEIVNMFPTQLNETDAHDHKYVSIPNLSTDKDEKISNSSSQLLTKDNKAQPPLNELINSESITLSVTKPKLIQSPSIESLTTPTFTDYPTDSPVLSVHEELNTDNANDVNENNSQDPSPNTEPSDISSRIQNSTSYVSTSQEEPSDKPDPNENLQNT